MTTAHCFQLDYGTSSGFSGWNPDTLRVQEVQNIARDFSSPFPGYARIGSDGQLELGLADYGEDIPVDCFGAIPPSARFGSPYFPDQMSFEVMTGDVEGNLGGFIRCISAGFGAIVGFSPSGGSIVDYGTSICGGVLQPPNSGNIHFIDGGVCPRIIPVLSRFEGPSLPRDFDALGRDLTATATPFRGGVHYREKPYTSPITLLALGETSQGLLSKIHRGSGRVTLPNGYTVNGVEYCGIDPNGTIYGGPEQYGNADGQIPDDYQRNSADVFNSLPSVFVRRGSYLRGVSEKERSGANFLRDSRVGTLVPQPFRLIKLQQPISKSEWLLSIDGAMTLVTVNTDPADGLYTIPEVWNKVFAPLLSGGASAFSPQLLESTFASEGGRAQRSDLVAAISKIQFLEYARCLRVPQFGLYQSQFPIEAPPQEPVIPK